MSSSSSIDLNHENAATKTEGDVCTYQVKNEDAPSLLHIVARFFQKFFKLSVPPNSVVKLVESTITMSPARLPTGGSQSRQLNSVLPAAVNGCGRLGSIGCRASNCTVFT